MSGPFRSNNTSVSSLVGVAILVGILVGFGLSTISYGAKVQFLGQSLPAQTMLSEEVVWYHEDAPTPRPPSDAEHELKYLTDMVAKTNGFYARDYSLWLGWNNVRGSIRVLSPPTHHNGRCAISSKQQSFMAGYSTEQLSYPRLYTLARANSICTLAFSLTEVCHVLSFSTGRRVLHMPQW